MYRVLALTVLLFVAGDSRPYSRAAAEKSFRTLLAAKDADILDLIKNDGQVCFADTLAFNEEDRFLTIELAQPISWFQQKSPDDSEKQGSIYDGKGEFPVNSPAFLSFHVWVNQDWTAVVDSGMEGQWHSYGHYEMKNGRPMWKPFGDIQPTFRFSRDKDELMGATKIGATQDGTTFYATKTYQNRNNGTTTYEMTVRLSTGRYKETWTPDKSEPIDSVGNCYKAKDFARPNVTTKKK